ncbi:ABC transporter substrate-binding protein [Embleya sp. NBC_00896]|uniref:ABC transporter substrate-binding protein n=1 Tax=Embleya sp. NBC_00896 TaxID=2975961 RepID=UPI00386B62F0|nr:ABC transporter substrate-binding protein [Embleya sp. NBC_00896]
MLALTATATTACGDDDKDGKAGGSDAPARIVALWQVKGEDPNAIDDYNNGAVIATERINAAGGVLGKPLQFERVGSPLTPQAARTAFLQAVDKKPSGIVGFPGGTEAEGLTRDFDQAKIPIINVNNHVPLAYGQKAGSEWMFSTNPYDVATARNMVALAQKQGWTRLGILGNDIGYGRDGTDRSKKAAEGTPVTVGTTRLVPVTATDVTEAVLALKGSQAVLSWTYPNVLAAQLTQMTQNGANAPVVGGGSVPVVANNKLAPPKALDQLYAVLACLPAAATEGGGKAFNDAYKAKYGTPAPPLAAAAHDAVMMQAEAIRKAGSTTDHTRIRDELAKLSWTGGACQPEYKADGSHYLAHQQVAIKYDQSGVAKIIDTYPIPALAKGAS